MKIHTTGLFYTVYFLPNIILIIVSLIYNNGNNLDVGKLPKMYLISINDQHSILIYDIHIIIQVKYLPLLTNQIGYMVCR